MNQKQQQLMDSLVRVRAFLDAHPLTGMVNASSARQMLDKVEQRVRACAGAQSTGLDSSRMEVRRQEDLITPLLDQFIRAIVTIVRASYRGNEAVLTTWRGARRVHQNSGGSVPRSALWLNLPTSNEADAKWTSIHYRLNDRHLVSGRATFEPCRLGTSRPSSTCS